MNKSRVHTRAAVHRRSIVATLLAITAALGFGCGDSGGAAGTTFAYVAARGELRTYRVDPVSGGFSLASVLAVPTTAGRADSSVLAHALGRFLYSATASRSLTAYRIDPASGALTLVQELLVAGNPARMYVSGGKLYLQAGGGFTGFSDHLHLYGIDEATGRLVQLAHHTRWGDHLFTVTTDPVGPLLYAARGSNMLETYRVTAAGGLEPTATTNLGYNPQALISAGLLYSAVGSIRAPRINTYTVEPVTGDIRQAGSIATPTLIQELAFQPSRRRLLAAADEELREYAVEVGSGAMTLAGSAPSVEPRLVTFDPSERFAYVLSRGRAQNGPAEVHGFASASRGLSPLGVVATEAEGLVVVGTPAP